MTKAFSLIELIFVIVIIGIISSFVIPSIKTNPLQEAAIQLASDIRYTQHLAMNDDQFDKNENNWYKKRWRIKFYNKNRADNKWSYSIFYEGDGANNAKLYSMAKNPLNINVYMSGGYNITGTTEEKKKLDYSENNESGLFIGTKKLNIGSTYMTNLVLQPDTINSFTLSFILYMVKGDTTQALNIIVWLAYSFNYLEKLPFTLVLHSDCDKYIQLFYEEVIEPFFNPDHCEEINSDDLTKKALSVKLDKKVIYHFKDIVDATIFKAPANELIKRVQYKDTYKLNNKTTITKANILITSTSNYIPLIAKDVKSIVVNVESDLKSFCKAKNITTDPYYTVADLIKHDLPNFSYIIRSMDMDKLYGLFHHNYYDGKNADIMDNNVDILEVFEASFRYQDKPFFKIIEKKSPKLYHQLMDDLNMNRVNRHKLLDYFSLLFGENIYKNNTALIAALKKISSTNQPFENDKPFQIGKNVYYKL